MTNADQKQITRATQHGRGALLRTLAIIHRAGSTRTQREVEAQISAMDAGTEFSRTNGALLHRSEL
jgi:hypothetical protein